MKKHSALELITLLSNRTRFALVSSLADIYPASGTVAVLSDVAGIAPGTARKQLRNLVDTGLIENARQGRTLRYRLNATAMACALDGIDNTLAPAKERSERHQRRQARRLARPYESLINKLNTAASTTGQPSASPRESLFRNLPENDDEPATQNTVQNNALAASIDAITARWQTTHRRDN